MPRPRVAPGDWTRVEVASGVALYHQIKQDLRRRVALGELGPGQPLPSEHQLCEFYGVSRPTVRQATQELVNERVLERRRGLGTFVARSTVKQELGGLRGFTEKMRLAGREPGTRVLSRAVVSATEATAGAVSELGLLPVDDVLRVVRLRLADGFPILLETLSVPIGRFPGLENVDLERASFYETLRNDYSVVISHLRETLEPVVLSADEARALETVAQEPSIRATIVTYDNRAEPIEHTVSVVRADASHYAIEVHQDPDSTHNRVMLRQPQFDVVT